MRSVAAAAARRAGGSGEEVRARPSLSASSFSAHLLARRQVHLALGSNVGDRAELLRAAVRALPAAGGTVHALSPLYETAPPYVTDQGRAPPPPRPRGAQRLGPRPVDLDIRPLGRATLDPELPQVPYPGAAERPFVLAPLADVVRDDGAAGPSPAQALVRGWRASGGEARVGAASSGLSRVLALPGGVVLLTGRSAPSTRLMLILNLTPDSFSDAGAAWSAGGARAGAETAPQGASPAGCG